MRSSREKENKMGGVGTLSKSLPLGDWAGGAALSQGISR